MESLHPSGWQLLMWGSILASTAGDSEAASRARDAAVLLLERAMSKAQKRRTQ